MGTLFAGTFGSEKGGWGYPYVQELTPESFVTALLLVPMLLALTHYTLRLRPDWIYVGLWLAVGFGAQLWMWTLAPFSIQAIIESPGATSYYNVTQERSAESIITHFHELVPSLPLHANTNLPGKTLFFYLLAALTSSPSAVGCLIMLISNLGGIFLFLLARHWYQDPLVARYALIFYLFLPAKLYFIVILNSVTPVFMLFSIWLFVSFLSSKNDLFLAALGAALYAMLIFEPLPFVTGLIYLALIARSMIEGTLSRLGLVKILVVVPGVFLLTHLLMAATLNFDVFKAFTYALDLCNYQNHVSIPRPYSIWLVQNLWDFFFNMGIGQSILFLASVAGTTWHVAKLALSGPGGARKLKSYLTRYDVLLLLTFTSILLILDVSGLNRGETIRLWIFLGVFMQMFAAHVCAQSKPAHFFAPVLAVTIVQATLCLTRIGFVVP